MAPIAMERSWTIDDSRFVPMQADVAATTRHLLWLMVQEMKGVFMPGAPVKWTVVESCDGVALAEEDLWTDGTKILRATSGPRSWIVLFNGAVYLLIHCSGTSDDRIAQYQLSLDRPVGGTVSSPPRATLATDEIASTWTSGFFTSGNSAWRIHARMDELGGFWIGLSQADDGFVLSFVPVMRLAGVPANDQFPWVLNARSSLAGRGAMQAAALVSTSYTFCSRAPDLSAACYLIPSGASRGLSTTYILLNVDSNPADGTLPRYSIPMKSSTVNYEHGRGYLPDWYWGPSEYPHGSMMPALPEQPQFVLFGDVWLPGDVPPIF